MYGRQLTATQVKELKCREFLGEETWIKWKQDMDSMLEYRKSFKGKPSEDQLVMLETNKHFIRFYNRVLFNEG